MIFAALCTAANIKQRHLIRGTGWATTANGKESRDQAAKTHQQLAPISNTEIECGTATATHFPTGEREGERKKERKQIWRTLLSGAREVLRLCISMSLSLFLCIHSVRTKMSHSTAFKPRNYWPSTLRSCEGGWKTQNMSLEPVQSLL